MVEHNGCLGQLFQQMIRWLPSIWMMVNGYADIRIMFEWNQTLNCCITYVYFGDADEPVIVRRVWRLQEMTKGKILQRHQYTHTNRMRRVVNHWAQSTDSQTNSKQWHRLHSCCRRASWCFINCDGDFGCCRWLLIIPVECTTEYKIYTEATSCSLWRLCCELVWLAGLLWRKILGCKFWNLCILV